jgi:hypothetical protein
MSPDSQKSDWPTVSQSVSQYVLVSSTLVGLATRYYFLSECCYYIRMQSLSHRKHLTPPLQSPTCQCCSGETPLFLVRWGYFTTDGQSVILGVGPTLYNMDSGRNIIYVYFYLFYQIGNTSSAIVVWLSVAIETCLSCGNLAKNNLLCNAYLYNIGVERPCGTWRQCYTSTHCIGVGVERPCGTCDILYI